MCDLNFDYCMLDWYLTFDVVAILEPQIEEDDFQTGLVLIEERINILAQFSSKY